MTYSGKHTWSSGETITTARLQNLEDGVGLAMIPRVRQSVQSAKTATTGYADFLAIGSGLSVNLQATATPLVGSFANGVDEDGDLPLTISADVTGAWSSLTANCTNYLYIVHNNGTPQYEATIQPPIYQHKEPSLSIATAGQAVSGGDLGGSPASNAFDGDIGTWWVSSQAGGSVPGVAYIGQNFGRPVPIRTISFMSYSDTNYNINSVKVQYSDNGSSWTDVGTYALTTTINTTTTLSLPASGTHQYWRLLANGTPASQWVARNITMELDTSIPFHWFNTTDMTMYHRSGSSWVASPRLFVGEAATNGTNVTSVTPYALRGVYDSGWFAVTVSTSYIKNHNIGVPLPVVDWYYSLYGDDFDAAQVFAYQIAGPANVGHLNLQDTGNDTRKNVYFSFGSVVQVYRGSNRTSGFYRIIARRNF